MAHNPIFLHAHSTANRARAGILLLVAVLVSAVVGAPATPAGAAAPALLRTDLRVLVVATSADGGGPTRPYEDLLTSQGIPFTRVTTTAAAGTITAGFLADTTGDVPRAKFQAVILPDATTGAGTGWRTALANYSSTYGIRQLWAMVVPSSLVALNDPDFAGQSMDGVVGQVTAAGKAAAFPYLKGPVPFDNYSATVSESWAYLATPLANPAAGTSMEVLVTGPSNSVLVGIHRAPGVENMVVTFDGNSGQEPFRLLGPGILNWVTGLTHLGLSRHYLSVHADDILSPGARWDPDVNCTPGEDCPADPTHPEIVMTPADVDALVAWQAANGIKIDMAYNAGASDGADPLTTALLAKPSLRWINHTFEHAYYGCVPIPSPPWNCASQPVGDNWVPYSTIVNDIQQNLDWASGKISVDKTELISGEHSGLADILPGRIQGDNPNFVRAITDLGIKVVAYDASKEMSPRTVGSAVTLPRYPNTIYYNVAKASELVDEFNFLYTQDNPATPEIEGVCVNTAVTTCITSPLGSTGFVDQLAPSDARATLSRILDNDPRPHYVHAPNLAEDRLVYTWLGLALAKFDNAVAGNAPIINPTMTQASAELMRQKSWASIRDSVTAYTQGGQVVITQGGTGGWVPLTAATGKVAGTQTAFGEAYAGTRSAWTYLAAGQSLKVDITDNVLPTASFTTSCTFLLCTVSSTSTDPDGTILSFEWDFGDGTPTVTGATPPAHQYAAEGTYTITLTVTDNRGGTATATKAQTVAGPPNQAPVATITSSCTYLSCTFDGSTSTDADGSIASYSWDFGDGSGPATGASTAHAFPASGDYTVALTVTDNKGATHTATKVVTVVAKPNAAPTASFSLVCEGMACKVDASASTDLDGTINSYQWSFGDGKADSGVAPVTHTYVDPGSYAISLTVFDNQGASATASKQATVKAAATPPVVGPPPPAAGPVVTTPPAGPTASPLPTPTVKVKAVSRRGKLKVDVNPNKGRKYWAFQVQRLAKDGTWKDYRKPYRTKGKKETRTLNFRKGTYRVVVLPKFGYGSVESGQVRLRR